MQSLNFLKSTGLNKRLQVMALLGPTQKKFSHIQYQKKNKRIKLSLT